MLNEDQLETFQRDGFLVVDGVLGDADLLPLEREYEILLDDYARELRARGDIGSRHEGLGFADRFARIVAEYPDCIDRLNISLPLENGAIDAQTRATDTWKRILAEFKPPAHDPDKIGALEEFIARRTEEGGAPPVS